MKNRVLIVRLDAIGDYVLWRNCLRFLRNCAKYRNSHLTVLGNPAWRNLAESFDADCADEWIWVENRGELFRRGWENLLPRIVWHRRVAAAQAKLKAELVSRGFDEVISPCAFPDALLDELVLGIAPVSISVANGNKARSGKFSRLVDSGADPFVFSRNRAIASAMAGTQCDVQLELFVEDPPAKTNRVLFFPGASHWTRRWPARRWRQLREMVPPGFETVVAPTGTTLAEFVRLVKSCAAVVSNDTMALHVAAAQGVPAVGIVNGVSGRCGFWPYPASLGKKVEVCIPKKIPRLPIPLLGSRLAQYIALSSVSDRSVANALRRVMGVPSS